MQCRACRRFNCVEKMDMNYVVPEDGKTLYDYFNDCTELQASCTDALPKILCSNCYQNLRQAYDFREEARRSDEELKKILALPKQEPLLIFNANEQSDILKHTETTTYDLPNVYPKSESHTYCNHTESSEILKDAESNSLSSTLKNEPLINNPTEEPLVFENIAAASTVDPLSPTEHGDQGESRDASIGNDLNPQLNTLKEEIAIETSAKSREDSSEESPYDDKEENMARSKITYTCDFCSFKSTKLKELRKHIIEKHEDSIICRKCSKVFELPRDMQLHEKLVHLTISVMRCPWCKNTTPLPHDKLVKHLQKKHHSAYLKYFPRTRLHGRDEDDPLECERCQKLFPSTSELIDHIQEHKFHCLLCTKKFKARTNLKIHMKRRHNAGKFNLRKDKNTQSQQSSADEGEQDGIDELVVCKYCHRKITASKIAIHEQRHASCEKFPKKYICSFCPRELKSAAAVRLHEKKVHVEEKPNLKECSICQKKVRENYLKTHMENMHTSEHKFNCDICGGAFKSHVLLLSHKKLHLNRKLACSMCNKKFVNGTELKVHMRMHTGEEPYACHLCDKRFRLKGLLTYHLQKHAGIKRKCNVCGKEFNNIGPLKIHSYKHTGMPYKCSVCDYGCAKRNVFRTHLLRVHNVTMSEEDISEMFKSNTGRNASVKTLEELQSQTKDVE